MVPMPTAVTQMGASYVHARLVLKAMVSPVQVKQLCSIPSKCISCMHVITNYIMYIILQMLMSVTEGWMNATRMQLATTILEVMTAFAMWGSLEMD